MTAHRSKPTEGTHVALYEKPEKIIKMSKLLIFKKLFNYLKGTHDLKIKNTFHTFPLACSAVYPSR